MKIGLAGVGLLFAAACGGSGAPGAIADGGAAADGGAPDAGVAGWPRPTCANPPSSPGPGPSARADVAGALSADGKSLVIFGGDTAVPVCGQIPQHTHAGDTWVLDLACGTWTPVTATPAPDARARHAMALDAARNRALLFGGRSRAGSSGDYTLYNDVWAFDFAAQTWSRLDVTGTPPSPRYNTAIAVVGKDLYVFGGSTSPSGLTFVPQNDAYALDVTTGAWRPVSATGAPPARLFHALAADPQAQRLYVYAGGDANAFAGPFFTDLWALDIAASRWSQIPIASSGDSVGRIKHGLVVRPAKGAADALLFVIAGHDDGALGNRNDVLELDVPNQSLPITTPQSLASISPGDELHSSPTGACNFPGDFVVTDPMSPERRSGFAVAPLTEGGAFVIFGGDSDCGLLDDAWWFDSATGVWTKIRDATVGLSCERRGFTNCPVLCG
jgi:hypothetical protein